MPGKKKSQKKEYHPNWGGNRSHKGRVGPKRRDDLIRKEFRLSFINEEDIAIVRKVSSEDRVKAIVLYAKEQGLV